MSLRWWGWLITKGCWIDSQHWMADVQYSSCVLEAGRRLVLHLQLYKLPKCHWAKQWALNRWFCLLFKTKTCFLQISMWHPIAVEKTYNSKKKHWSCSRVAKLIISPYLWTMSFPSYLGENKVSAMRAQRIHIYNLRLTVCSTLQHPLRHTAVHLHRPFNRPYIKAHTMHCSDLRVSLLFFWNKKQ